MTNIQLYLAIGVPSFMVILGVLAGIFQTTQLNARFTSLENNMNARFNSIDSRFTSIDSRFTLIEQDLKMLVRATNELDVRIARLEERSTR